MELNPYESPTASGSSGSKPGFPRPPLLLVLNSVLLLAVTAFFFLSEILAIADFSSGSLFALFVLLCIGPVLLGAATAMCWSVFKRSPAATHVATACYFAGAGLALLLVADYIHQTVLDGIGRERVMSVCLRAGIGLLIAAYAGWCGLISLRWGGRVRATMRKDLRAEKEENPTG